MPEPDPVNPGVLDPAIRQGQVPGIVRHDHRGDAHRRLAVAVFLGRKQVAAVAKRQPLEGQVLDDGAGIWLAFDFKERVGDESHDVCTGRVLTGERDRSGSPCRSCDRSRRSGAARLPRSEKPPR